MHRLHPAEPGGVLGVGEAGAVMTATRAWPGPTAARSMRRRPAHIVTWLAVRTGIPELGLEGRDDVVGRQVRARDEDGLAAAAAASRDERGGDGVRHGPDAPGQPEVRDR